MIVRSAWCRRHGRRPTALVGEDGQRFCDAPIPAVFPEGVICGLELIDPNDVDRELQRVRATWLTEIRQEVHDG